MKTSIPNKLELNVGLIIFLMFVSSCSVQRVSDPVPSEQFIEIPPQAQEQEVQPTRTLQATEPFQKEDFPDDDVATLSSLERVDEYPLYTMTYYGSYKTGLLDESLPASTVGAIDALQVDPLPSFACSLFVTLADAQELMYGRNFDWQYSPALFLYTDPMDGYASVSMVNIAFIRDWGGEVKDLAELPLDEIESLLRAPDLPIDGMNDQGLVVGMAAVPSSPKPYDPSKETISSLAIIREMLDHAQNVDEAVAIMDSYNIDWLGGPPIHYLIADRYGESVLVEYYENKMVVLPDGGNWHQATNFILSSDPQNPDGRCWRYDAISQQMNQTNGKLSVDEAIELLSDVSQGSTQWSVVYDISGMKIHVVMGRDYDQVITLQMDNSVDPR
jgi:hypothetical protein